MRRRFRQHVNPLKMSSLVPRDQPLDLPDQPVLEVELGCGDGQFLVSRSQIHPERFFLGFDIRKKLLQLAMEDIQRQGLKNVQLYPSNLMVDLDQLFPPNRVHRFYINFPDPWFKQSHHNRRWLTAEALTGLVNALGQAGEIFFQSDVWSLAIEALALFEGNQRLRNTCGEWTFLRCNPFAAHSSRERTCLADGRAIWRLLFSHRP